MDYVFFLLLNFVEKTKSFRSDFRVVMRTRSSWAGVGLVVWSQKIPYKFSLLGFTAAYNRLGLLRPSISAD